MTDGSRLGAGTDSIEIQVRELLAGTRPLPLLFAGDPVLRQQAAPYTGQLESDLLGELVEAMRETMHAAPGVGLAAPQIGVGLQIAVVEDPATVPSQIATARERRSVPFEVIINPSYRPFGTRRAIFYEGCLSVPGYQGVVDRAADVRLDCLDHNLSNVCRDVSGWPARIVQHETDHLHGTLYLDRALTRSLSTTANYEELWLAASVDAARAALNF